MFDSDVSSTRWQGSLFDEFESSPGAPARRSGEDSSRDSAPGDSACGRRDWLDATSWIDVVPGWLNDHASLFEWLLHNANWRQRRRKMWDNEVMEPRLTTGWKEANFPDPIRLLAQPLNEAYSVRFDSCLVNLYRDGSDAVAWHGDTVRKVMRNPLVVTVSLGARRPFLVKPAAGGRIARRYAPGEGDLLVMGGAMQHDWLHTVPRQRSVCGARMSITLRHSLPRKRAPDPQPGACLPGGITVL